MTALTVLQSLPAVPLAPHASPIDELARLRAALGPACPRLLMKRDDLLSFAMGGNKVRKLETVAAEALAARADLLITCGGIQSNHARVTAAAGACLGLPVVLVLNGSPPATFTGNTRLDNLFGAEIVFVPSRELRAPTMDAIAREREAAGRRPWIVPLGASTPVGALGFARAIGEIVTAGARPDAIVTATSSGGTQAGLVAGAALFGLRTRVIGVSADESSATLVTVIDRLLDGMAVRLGAKKETLRPASIDVDDRFVGEGYGTPTPASLEAMTMVARCEGVVLDPVYTAKAMAGLIADVRENRFRPDETVLFWHTGGQPGLFA